MRKSNRVVLSLVAYFVLFLLLMQIVLYARYQNKLFKTERIEDHYILDNYPGVRFILLIDLGSVELQPSDTVRVEVSRLAGTLIREQHGDTLLLKADKPATGVDYRLNAPIRLSAPTGAQFIAKKCDLFLKGNRDLTAPFSWTILADQSKIHTEEVPETLFNQHFSELTLNGSNGSEFLLSHALVVDLLHLNLRGTAFRENEAKLNELTLVTDSANVPIELSQSSLSKLLQTKNP